MRQGTCLHHYGPPVKYYPIGTHSWPYWQAPLHVSWPLLARGLAVA
jgi:S-formylglutathione hydrolase FrmB